MDFKAIVAIFSILFVFLVYATQAIAFEANARELKKSVLLPTILTVFVLGILLYAASLQPGSIVFWSSVVGVIFFFWGLPSILLLQKAVFPRFQKKYGLRRDEYRELGHLTILNRRKMKEMWESRRNDIKY
ncbi:MAG: hypothetical protein ACYDCP_08880 [Thermoplasmataceae archaeon]|jgi:hypothetical protein